MSNSWEFSNTSAGRVLKAIQVRGRAKIKDVAADLGVTPSAVRLQLTQLQASGAIQADKVRDGVGRPHFVYSATPQAQDLFHKDYGELARLVLQQVRDTQGKDVLRVVLQQVAERLASKYRDEVQGGELGDRVAAWAELLDEKGVSVQVLETGEGYLLKEYGCPYYNVAQDQRAVCEMEQQVMARLFEAGVSLTACVWDGHHACQFTIVEDQAQGEARE